MTQRTKKHKGRRGWHDGSIFTDKTGRYRAQVSLPNGKRKSKTFVNITDARAWIRETLSAPAAAEAPSTAATTWTVRDWFNVWLPQSKNTIRPSTHRDYARLSEDYILPSLGATQLSELTRRQVNQLYADMMAKHQKSAYTTRLTHRILHRALEVAVQDNLIPSNPAHGAAVPRVEEKEMRILSEPQVWTFLAAVHGHEREALYHIALKCGLRQAELLGLQWSDLDLHHGTLTIQRQAKRVGGQGIVMAPLKTKSSRRTVYLGETTLNLLRVHRINQDALQAEQGAAWQDHNLIFCTITGTPVDQSNLTAEFKAILELAGLPEIRFHDMRHTAASVMLKNLRDVLVVSRTLGHSRPSTTLNVYSHLMPGVAAEAAQQIDQVLSPLVVNGAGQNEPGAAVQAEIESGMNLGWRRRWPPTRKKKAADA